MSLQGYFSVTEGVVKRKRVILDVFGDAIHLVLGLVHFDLRIGRRDRVDLSVFLLFLEDGSLPHTDR